MLKEVSKDEAMQAAIRGESVMRIYGDPVCVCDISAEMKRIFIDNSRYLVDEPETNITFTEPDVAITDGVKKQIDYARERRNS